MNVIYCPKCQATDIKIVKSMLENHLVEARLKCEKCEYTWERSITCRKPKNDE